MGAFLAISRQIELLKLKDLWLDPKNPRLGADFARQQPTQDEILTRMQTFALEELATSFLETSFWPQEALITVIEEVDGVDRRIVVEGNRRLAALKLLKAAYRGKPVSRRWKDFAERYPEPPALFSDIPCMEADTRQDVAAFLGFRHVTGIKDWPPAEKAEFIAYLIDDLKLSYEDVMRRVGSNTPTVRKHYIAYKILSQLSEEAGSGDFNVKFGVWYRAFSTPGIAAYIGVDLNSRTIKATASCAGSYPSR
jgi:hypothetical protein